MMSPAHWQARFLEAWLRSSHAEMRWSGLRAYYWAGLHWGSCSGGMRRHRRWFAAATRSWDRSSPIVLRLWAIAQLFLHVPVAVLSSISNRHASIATNVQRQYSVAQSGNASVLPLIAAPHPWAAPALADVRQQARRGNSRRSRYQPGCDAIQAPDLLPGIAYICHRIPGDQSGRRSAI
jgi:hypothetical protein